MTPMLRRGAFAAAATACAAAALSTGSAAVPGGVRYVTSETVTTRDFVLPAGRTIVVGRELRVHASGRIVIAGTIDFAPGAGVALRGDRVLVSGRIGPVSGARQELAARRAAITNPIEIVPIEGQKSVTVTGRVMADPGQSIIVAAGLHGSITIKGHLETADGADSQTPGVAGGKAGSIVMKAEVFEKAAKITIGKGAVVRAGDGGAGYYADHEVGEMVLGNPCHGGSRSVYRLIGSDGGAGGSVRLLGAKIVDKGEITVGSGGHGGRAGDKESTAPDGGEGIGGTDFYASSGDGGPGGSIEAPGSGLEEEIYAGAGGSSGNVGGAAGDGGPGCDGGDTYVQVGDVGPNGTSGKEPKRQPHPGEVLLLGGGRGGASDKKTDDGGDAGNTTIHVPRDRVGEVTLLSYDNGGDGFNGCRPTPKVHGTDGGDAGRLRISGGAVRAKSLVSGSFDGGDAGDGTRPGISGDKGSTNYHLRENNSYDDGNPGTICGLPKKKRPPSHGVTTKTTTVSNGNGSIDVHKYECDTSAHAAVLLDDTNGEAVGNGGAPPTFSTGGKPYCVTEVQTYHWNAGNGQPPGQLGLVRESGPKGAAATIGPFNAQSSSGQNGAPNVNWYVYVPAGAASIIDGSYRCTDTGVATWSANKASGGLGFCIVQAVPAKLKH